MSRRRPVEADVTVCIPAYQAEGFIENTLSAVRGQTHESIRVLVSLDASTDDTERIGRRHAREDPRLELFVQRRRLGWIANTNFLLERVRTPLFFIMPHDDGVDETYVEVLRREAVRRPEAAGAYSDMQMHGAKQGVRAISGLEGPPFDRLLHFVTAKHTGVPWRGLTRSSALERGLRMRDNHFDGFGGVVLWLLELLCLGPLLRVPRPLYHRHLRRQPTSVTEGWSEQGSDVQVARMTYRTSAEQRVLAAAPVQEHELAALMVAQIGRALKRLSGAGGDAGPATSERGERAQLAMLGALAVRRLGGPEPTEELMARLRHDERLWAAIAGIPDG